MKIGSSFYIYNYHFEFQNIGSNSISSDDSVLVREYYYLDKEVTDTGFLGKELTDFYKTFELPLYKEVKVPDDAVMLNMTQPQGKNN